MKNNILMFLILATIIHSCETKIERQNQIETFQKQLHVAKIKYSSTEILSRIKKEIENSKDGNNVVWKTNIDSIYSEWEKIHKDSAELGLVYVKNFDSIYHSKSIELKAKEKVENEKALVESKRKLEKLKIKFTFKKDEFEDIGFYTHKRWGKFWPNRKTLTAGVNSTGYTWLCSNYSAEAWLFHTSITILIGDIKFTSPTVETFSANNKTDHSGGRIWEVITFGDDFGILNTIAENTDKIIKIRFNGSEFYDDITLSSADKQALKDCYELGLLLESSQ